MYRSPINAIAALVLALAAQAFSANAGAGQYLIFKGMNVTHSCLDGLIQLPANDPVFAQPLVLSCTEIAYQETDTLVFDPSSTACMTYADFASATQADIEDTFIQYSSTVGPLLSLLDDVFIADENAVVVFDPNTGEVARGESTTCAQDSAPPPAVNCQPDPITLSSQAEVDSFQADYGPGCNTIVTGLTIDGLSITDLTPLSDLTTALMNSTVRIQNTSLTSLAGLDNLSSVYWIEFNNNSLLTSITALSALTSVSGPLQFNGNTALTNLNGLDNLTSLTGGALYLANNTALADLSGVSGVTNIGASLVVTNNDALTDLDSFAGLSSVAHNIAISHNDALTSISGLSGMVNFTAALWIEGNSKLVNFGNLPNLTNIGGLVIFNNDALIDINGLSAVTTIGDLSALAIRFNDSLTNIDGLAGLVSVDSEVQIRRNKALTNINGLAELVSVNSDVEITDNWSLELCSSLLTLLDQVDDALPGPGPGAAGIPDVNGDVTINGNLEGCNSIDDIVGSDPPPDIQCPGAIFCDGFEGGG